MCDSDSEFGEINEYEVSFEHGDSGNTHAVLYNVY